jgi:ABC-type branched-subunit amino acid transport system ATPase component
MEAPAEMLRAEGIVKRFGGVFALDGVDLCIEKGEIRGLIGPNGSGKTTLFNVLTGYEMPTAGTVTFMGKKIEERKPHERSRSGIARTFQHIELFKGMTVLENVTVAAQCRSRADLFGILCGLPLMKAEERMLRERAEKALEFVGIGKFRDARAQDLAYGQQRLVEIARTLATDPSVLLLDEPAAGMNPTEKQNLALLIRKIRQLGVTIILIEHDMKMVVDLADRITVLDCGKKLAEGTPKEIQANDAVIEAYLGGVNAAAVPTAVALRKESGGIALSLSGVDTYYGAVHVLKNASFTVGRGELVALIGANGAGKTTLLRTISGMISPRSGTIEYEGVRIDGLPADRLVRRGLVHVPEGRGIFPQLTVKENIKIGAFLRKDKIGIAEDLERTLELFPRLRERIGQLGGSLSGGEQQMLAIARGMLSRPRLLLLDEPSMGLSPKLVEEVLEVVRKIHETGQTIVLVEQNAKAALAVADRAFVLEVGEIVLEGLASELLDNPKVKTAYLGG